MGPLMLFVAPLYITSTFSFTECKNIVWFQYLVPIFGSISGIEGILGSFLKVGGSGACFGILGIFPDFFIIFCEHFSFLLNEEILITSGF